MPLYRWIKASERLPDVTELLQELVVRYNDKLFIAGITDEGKIGEPSIITIWIEGSSW